MEFIINKIVNTITEGGFITGIILGKILDWTFFRFLERNYALIIGILFLPFAVVTYKFIEPWFPKWVIGRKREKFQSVAVSPFVTPIILLAYVGRLLLGMHWKNSNAKVV
jgi:hypothetical protein